jgi:hypothetical protein
MVFPIRNIVEAFHELILIELEGDGEPFESIPIDNIFLLYLLTSVTIEDSLTYLFCVLFMVMFLKLSDKLYKLILGEGLFLVIKLFHEGQKNQFILVTDLTYLVEGVVQGTDNLRKEL